MDWRNPSLLYWLLPTTMLWGVISWFAYHRNRVLRPRFVLGTDLADRLLPKASRGFLVAKVVCQMFGCALLWIAFAGPQWGERWEETQPRGTDLYILLDVSRSMLASDVPPSRLERAKADIATLTNRMAGERIGLVVFAGKAVVKCPLTVDYDAFRRSLADVDTQSAPRGGTAIGDAIRKALEVFSGNAQRNQAILLITDGDDQESFPMEAAEVAAERNVPIFAVGLGDASTGARIPQKPQSGSYVEYDGEQVWSKLDNSLLEQIATKTSGVYVPAGTKTFDLAEIYSTYLEGRTGDAVESQRRLRRADQYQWFLAFGVMMFLLDALWRPFRKNAVIEESNPSHLLSSTRTGSQVSVAVGVLQGLVWIGPMITSTMSYAADPNDALLRGLEHYSKQKYEDAKTAFAEATQELEKSKSRDSSIAIFDQACTEHRLGNREAAIDLYLKGAMSRDKGLAAKSQFNLGRLHVESIQSKIGEKGNDVVAEKEREEIVDLAKQAIQAYRNSLELDPSNVHARRNLERVRQWLKVTTDRWIENDRNKRRDETNLLQFLEYLIESEKALFSESAQLKDLYSLDQHAELRQTQERILEELPFLNRKIEKELSAATEERDTLSQPSKSGMQGVDQETREAIDLLQNWSDIARDHMRQSSKSLGEFKASKGIESQRGAIEELERIWDAIAPFEAMLARALQEQTAIAKALETKPETTDDPLGPELEWDRWQKEQQTNLRRTESLAPKAQAALSELEAKSNQPTESMSEQQPKDEGTPTDPEAQAKRADGLKKGIELGPKAVEQMEFAIRSLKQKEAVASGAYAEEARKILEEMAKSQPPSPQNNESSEQDKSSDDKSPSQEQQDSSSSSSDGKDAEKGSENEDKKSKEDPKSDTDQADSQKEDKSKDGKQEKDKERESKEDPSKNEKSAGSKPSPKDNREPNKDSVGSENRKKVTSDRVEEALRKVREREAQKRERDRQLRAKALGRPPVDKDW